MTTWVLILFFHVGPMGKGNSNATTSVPNFKTEAACVEAGRKAGTLVAGTVKQMSFVCVQQ